MLPAMVDLQMVLGPSVSRSEYLASCVAKNHCIAFFCVLGMHFGPLPQGCLFYALEQDEYCTLSLARKSVVDQVQSS